MKNKILLAVLIFLQTLFPQKLSHPLRAEYGGHLVLSTQTFPDTVQILAIMVQFQPDNDSRTSGNGQFDLTLSNERIIDAPPHDSAYFAHHGLFVQNYFSKASNGKQHVRMTLLSKVVTVKKTMKDYAPVNGNLPLTNLIEEAWKGVDSLYAGFPFQQYDLFTIFHAGVGKDIDLRAALGYDPTPLDLPSLYFNLNSLKSLLGNSYQGVTLNNSSFKIPNSIILPETEVRRIPSVGGEFVLKLGINGLFAASIGSYLGLPDLFDTKSGKSGIGRFGLMDGQSIFSFSGIAPPEPSAWEKSFLGWTTPIEIFGNKSLSIPAVGLYSIGNDTIYKIPISAKEYYLVENRQRDAKNNGQTVTLQWKGQTILKTFSQDENFFSNSNIDSAYGVITDVDELDWSVPGLINANNSYKGGILIWHIDETIIEKNLVTNSINADPANRGVDVEEADGSQDIGQTYDFGDPASGSEDGSPIDYWFSGNIFPSYKNEFSEYTNPNSLSNTFAKTHVTLKNFSLQSPRMTFDAIVGNADIQLVRVVKRNTLTMDNNDTPIIFDIYRDGKSEVIFTSGENVNLLDQNFNLFFKDTTGFIRGGNRYIPTVIRSPFGQVNDVELAIAYKNSIAMTGLDTTGPGGFTFTFDTTLTTPIYSMGKSTGDVRLVAGTKNGKIVQLNSGILVNPNSIQVFSDSIISIALTPSGWVAADNDSLKNSDGKGVWLEGEKAAEIVNAQFEPNGDLFTVVRFQSNVIAIYNSTSLTKERSFKTNYSGFSTMAIADINGDGKLDILVGTGNSLSAYNRNGTMIEHFPFTVKDGGNVVGNPVVVGQNNSNSIAILFGSTAGHLYAINEKGKMLQGFPLQTGGIASSPAVNADYLIAATLDTALYVWKITGMFDTSRVYWNGYLADRSHSNFVKNNGVAAQKSSELLPKKFAYNWPNPVYNGSTNIRYYLGKAATVKITIVNLAGELVQELQGTNYIGLDNEVSWNISNVQSGIYFAQITATGSGEEVSQIVKIAVVK